MKGNLLSLNPIPIFVSLAGLIVAGFLGSVIGEGYVLELYAIIFGLVGAIVILWLGPKYWLLIPFSLSFSAPVIPLGQRAVELPELVIVVCAIIFLIRISLRAQRIHLLRSDHIPFLLYTGWAALIYFHNPIGFSGFGASSGGGRFYLKIFLAFAAFLIVANQRITNRDCKWILIGTVVGSALDLGKMLVFYYIFGGGEMFADPLESYSWQQQLSTVPLVIVLVLFARYSSAEILSLTKIWRSFLLFVCIPIILLSGKRAAVGSLVLYPAIAAFCRREFRYVFLWVVCALVGAAVLVGGQGTVFHLPLTAQRSLSWLPGQWDPQLAFMEGGKDQFRTNLRSLAVEKIRRDPWIGRGYDVQLQAAQRLMSTMGNKSDALITQMALGSQWHNQWLGYAADLGIPASILLAVIYLFVISRSWWGLPRLPRGSLLQTMVMFILIRTVTTLAFSQTGGHSATDAFDRWWMYGVLVSITVAVRSQKAASRGLVESQAGRPNPPVPNIPAPSAAR
jgi:hypothetical protein